MTVILRFANQHGRVVERFFAIQHVSDASTFSLKVTLDELLAHCSLSILKLREQRYNGASNMERGIHWFEDIDFN